MQGRIGNADMSVAQRASSSERVTSQEAVFALLIACGIVSSVLYVAADVISALRSEGYEYHGQAISELAAAGAPSRPLFVALMLTYNALLLAFTAGIWRSAHGKRAVYYMAAAFMGNVAVGTLGLLLFNMDQRGAEETVRGSLHGPVTLVESIFIMASMAFAAAAFGRRFRFYSVVTIAVLIVFGIWTSLSLPAMAAGEPTPWMGIIERVNVYAYLLWVAVLAVVLWRNEASLKDLPEAPRHQAQ